ncbi:MAG: DUF3857 and transglutaminase domain-containing protein [Cyclobacteriaceae bacterium]
MKKKAFFIAVCLLLCTHLFAQDTLYQSGVITAQEWNMTTYDKDPEAAAVILFDIGEIDLEQENGIVRFAFRRKRRIKVLKEGGQDFGDMSFSYNKNQHKLKSLKAATYNKSGDKVIKKELKESSVFEEEINAYFVRKKFVLPDVQVGSIIEYEINLTVPFGSRLPEWRFQSNLPTIHSEFKATIVKGDPYYVLQKGFETFTRQDSVEINIWENYESNNTEYLNRSGWLFNKELTTHTYVLKDVPAFEEEAFTTSMKDNIMKMELRLNAKTMYSQEGIDGIIYRWNRLNNFLLQTNNFGLFLQEGNMYARKVLRSELDLRDLSEEEKARRIIEFVRKTYIWNGNFSDRVDRSAKDFYKMRTGNSAAINLFMTCLLRAAGLSANPVILSTRDNGQVDLEYPYLFYYNHAIVIVSVGDRSYLSDGTTRLLPYDKIPPYCINGKGMIINEDGSGLVRLDNRAVSTNSKLLKISLDAEQKLVNAQVTFQATRYVAWYQKRRWENDEEKIKAAMQEIAYTDVGNIKTFNYDKNSKPYITAFTGNYEIESVGDRMIFSPFLNFVLKENPLKKEKRVFPVDFNYLENHTFKSQITIPEGYNLTNIPEDLRIDDDIARISLQYKVTDRQLIVDGSYLFKKIIYQPDMYSKLKEYFNLITENFNRELVFKPL